MEPAEDLSFQRTELVFKHGEQKSCTFGVILDDLHIVTSQPGEPGFLPAVCHLNYYFPFILNIIHSSISFLVFTLLTITFKW